MWKCRTCRSCDRPFNFHLPLIGGARKKHKKIQPHGSCSCCPCADVALAPALTLCDLAPDWPIAAAEVLIDLSSSASATYKNKKGSHACLSWRSTEQEGITCPNNLFASSPPSSFHSKARPGHGPTTEEAHTSPVQCQWVHTVQAAGAAELPRFTRRPTCTRRHMTVAGRADPLEASMAHTVRTGAPVVGALIFPSPGIQKRGLSDKSESGGRASLR